MIREYPIENPSFIEWSPVYLEVADKITKYIQKASHAVKVHHVGSTSIPDCGGKGSIDLAVVYQQGQLEIVRNIIDGLGFQKQKTRNPFPESRPMRTGAIDYDGQLFKVHVHILQKDSEEFAEMLRFRDSLEKDDVNRLEYVKLKKRILEAGVKDSIQYSELKGAFFERGQ